MGMRQDLLERLVGLISVVLVEFSFLSFFNSLRTSLIERNDEQATTGESVDSKESRLGFVQDDRLRNHMIKWNCGLGKTVKLHQSR